MPSCLDVDPLFTPYVDGEATAAKREIVDAHIRACPKCRHQTALQAATRESVRTKLCRPCAPEQLRARCRAAAYTGPFGIPRTLVSLSIAAALALIVGGVLLYALSGLPTVLAAQLTLDHVTCFTVHASSAAVDPRDSEAQYAREYGQVVRLPSATVAGLQLVGVRRCYCGEGAAAHAMYRLHGRAVSLYIIPDASRARASADVFGHDAVIWSNADTTYVLISREPVTALQELASAMNGSI